MLKKNALWISLSFCLMILLPWCAVTFVKGDGGMAVCLLLFFIVDPVFSLCSGMFAGRHIRTAWFQPLLNAVLFVLGAWMCFDLGETAFLLYAGIYLILGYAAAAISWFLSKQHHG